MDSMIASGGSYPQRALLVGHDGTMHLVVVADEPLHGRKMASMLSMFATQIGGADVIAVQSDARLKQTTGAQWEAEREDYSIAEDTQNPECLVTVGRSREHSALIVSRYSRTAVNGGKDIIVFDKDQPEIETLDRMTNFMIPDIWEPVN